MIRKLAKKNIVILLLLTSICGFAQQKITVGPEVNMNIQILPKNDLNKPVFLSPRFGVKGEFYFNPRFSIGTGIYYTIRKVQYHSEYSETTPSLSRILSLLNNIPDMPFDFNKALNTDSKIVSNGLLTEHFIEIPILISYHNKGITLFGGGYVDFLTGVHNKQVVETTTPFVETVNYKEIAGAFLGTVLSTLSPPAYSKEITTSHSKNGLNKNDFGIIAGVGYEFKNLNFNISYAHGFKDYRQDRGNNPKVVASIIRFSIGYNLNFKIKQKNQP